MLGEAVKTSDMVTTAARLREAFDAAFAAPPPSAHGEPLDLLSIRLGGDPFAMRLADTAGLFADRKVTPVPTTTRALRGVAGLRGMLAPVYDLGVLLGYPPATSVRWLVLAREVRAALAFDVFDGQLRVERAGLLAYEGAREHAREVIRDGTISRSVIHLPSVIAAIRAGTRGDRIQEEAAP